MRFSSLREPCWNCFCKSSRVTGRRVFSFSSREITARLSASWRAAFSSFTTSIRSPAPGTLPRPSTTTGVAGVADVIRWPRSSSIALIRPNVAPATIESPIFSVPWSTRIVATTPRPRSSSASITVPVAGALGSAFGSTSASATSRIFSSRSSRPSFSLAETSTVCTSPP